MRSDTNFLLPTNTSITLQNELFGPPMTTFWSVSQQWPWFYHHWMGLPLLSSSRHIEFSQWFPNKPQPIGLCIYLWEIFFRSVPYGTSRNLGSYPCKYGPTRILGSPWHTSLVHWTFAWTLLYYDMLHPYYRDWTLHWYTTIISINFQISRNNNRRLLKTRIQWHTGYN